MYLNKPHKITRSVLGVYGSPLVFRVSATNFERVLLNNVLSEDKSICSGMGSIGQQIYFYSFSTHLKFFTEQLVVVFFSVFGIFYALGHSS